MNELVEKLIEKNEKQREVLLELQEILCSEKEMLKKSNSGNLPGILEKLQEVSGRAMLAEAQRDRAAGELAHVLGCRPVVSQICEYLDSEANYRLQSSAKDLLAAVVSIKELNFVISRQADEHRFLADMILEKLRSFGGVPRAGLDRRA
jgi:hypothetical protein